MEKNRGCRGEEGVRWECPRDVERLEASSRPRPLEALLAWVTSNLANPDSPDSTRPRPLLATQARWPRPSHGPSRLVPRPYQAPPPSSPPASPGLGFAPGGG